MRDEDYCVDLLSGRLYTHDFCFHSYELYWHEKSDFLKHNSIGKSSIGHQTETVPTRDTRQIKMTPRGSKIFGFLKLPNGKAPKLLR